MYHNPPHHPHRGRSRMERERVDYEEEYSSSGAGMPVYHPPPHHMHHAHHPQYHAVPRETYPPPRGGPHPPHNMQPPPHMHPAHSHRTRDPNDDYHSPHQASSRRALNAI